MRQRHQVPQEIQGERTRISCHAALDKTACVPFLKERRTMFANATNIHRKSGVAQWRDLRFSFSSHADSKALMSPRAVCYGCCPNGNEL